LKKKKNNLIHSHPSLVTSRTRFQSPCSKFPRRSGVQNLSVAAKYIFFSQLAKASQCETGPGILFDSSHIGFNPKIRNYSNFQEKHVEIETSNHIVTKKFVWKFTPTSRADYLKKMKNPSTKS